MGIGTYTSDMFSCVLLIFYVCALALNSYLKALLERSVYYSCVLRV